MQNLKHLQYLFEQRYRELEVLVDAEVIEFEVGLPGRHVVVGVGWHSVEVRPAHHQADEVDRDAAVGVVAREQALDDAAALRTVVDEVCSRV